MVFEDLDQDFIDYIKHISKEAVAKAEIELSKAKECKDLLELPQRRENWEAMENADTDVDEHMKKVMFHLKEVVMLTRGLEIIKEGLMYRDLKNKKVKVK